MSVFTAPQGSSYAAVSEDGAAALGEANLKGTRNAKSRLVRTRARSGGGSLPPALCLLPPLSPLLDVLRCCVSRRQGSHYARRAGRAKGVFSAAEGTDATLEELRVYVGEGMEGNYL